MRPLVALGLIAIMSPISSHGATSAPCPALSVSATIFDKARIASTSGWKRTETLDFIGRGMEANKKQMLSLFQQLADPNCKKVKIIPEANAAAMELSKPKAKSDAADLLAMWATPPEKMEAAMEVMWKDGASGYRKMALFMQSTAATRNATISFVGRKVRAAWDPSTMSNGYKPFHDLMTSRYDMANAIENDTQLKKWELELIYRGAKLYDDFCNGAIPDHLYDFTKPPA